MPDQKPTLDYAKPEPVSRSGWGCILRAMVAGMVLFILIFIVLYIGFSCNRSHVPPDAVNPKKQNSLDSLVQKESGTLRGP
jgi:hypothetical protein